MFTGGYKSQWYFLLKICPALQLLEDLVVILFCFLIYFLLENKFKYLYQVKIYYILLIL